MGVGYAVDETVAKNFKVTVLNCMDKQRTIASRGLTMMQALWRKTVMAK